ncbi:MAG: substrate-binding domain-containing protein [Nocardioidaceae bacterium]
MREAGLASCHHDGYFRIDGGYEATKQLLRHPEVSAMVVANNLMALGALTAVHELRLSIPDDIAMVGLDDPSWASHLNPPLTTLAQPITSMARSAIDLLLQRIGDGHLEPQRRTFDFALRPRGSCGASTATDRTLAASQHCGESMMSEPVTDVLLSMRGIAKSFGGIRALQDADFELRRGEVHALLGQNGAGKSTLVNIMSGVYVDYEGDIELDGTPVSFRAPRRHRQRGWPPSTRSSTWSRR